VAGAIAVNLHNAPSGWAAFRALRQTPAHTRPVHHGNLRHGGRSREFRVIMRELRFAGWLMRKPGRLMAMPDALLDAWCPPRPMGWQRYSNIQDMRNGSVR